MRVYNRERRMKTMKKITFYNSLKYMARAVSMIVGSDQAVGFIARK